MLSPFVLLLALAVFALVIGIGYIVLIVMSLFRKDDHHDVW